MKCMYCNAPRLANEAPCPQCGAPSPLSGIGGMMGSYGNAQPSAARGLQPVNQPPTERLGGNTNNKSLRAHVMAPVAPTTTQSLPQNQPPSFLPVPYQPGRGVATQPLILMSQDLSLRDTALISAAGYNLPSLAPVPPELADAGESIHIPPMYTRPRAIIPPYRIISGLLSLLIVSTLFLSGTAYYAKVSGKLAFFQRLLGDVQLQNLAPLSAHALPNPPLNPDYGPARDIINSASTASKIELQTAIALQPSNVFAPNQIIYLTYSVHPKTTGVVVLNWYTDDILYKTITTKPIPAAKNGIFTNGFISVQYTQPAEGKVELYWNGQLAIRLYFVVR